MVESLTSFSEDTGLIVGRSLVNPTSWSVPVLVTNFSKEDITIGPFTEIAMMALVAEVQLIDSQERANSGDRVTLMVDGTSPALTQSEKDQLAAMLLRYTNLFPTMGTTLTGHTDVVQHEIDTESHRSIRCAPRRMAPAKMAAEDKC